MAAQKPGASGWGSFLSQAVAGVESRLDNMLGDEPQKQQQQQPIPAPKGAPMKTGTRQVAPRTPRR